MQQLSKRAPIVYFAFLSFITIITVIFISLGYRFVASNEILWFVMRVFLIGLFTIFCISKRNTSTTGAKIIAQLLPFLSVIHIDTTISLANKMNSSILSLYAIFCFSSCFAVSLLYSGNRIFKILCTVFNIFLLFIVLLIAFLLMLFGDFGQDTIKKSTTSPSGSYTAVLIDSDQGALGGNTYVDVKSHVSEIYLGVGRLTKTKRLYWGKWGEYRFIQLSWIDDQTLSINGTPYKLD